MEALTFTVRQMDPTTWTDYVAAVGVAAFTAFVLFCMLMVAFMAKVQYRTDIMLKGSLWLWIWMIGALLVVWADFISNKYLDVLDPIRNVHCPLWDYWVLVLGIAMYYAFQGYIMLEHVIRSIARIEGTAHPYQSVGKLVAEDEERQQQEEEEGEQEHGKERYVDVDIADQEAEVIPGEEPSNIDKLAARRLTEKLDKAAMKNVGFRVSVKELVRKGWGNISEARRYSLLKSLYMIYVFSMALLVCGLAELPGVTWYHVHAEACLTVWYFKLLVILDMFSFLAILWLLYRRLRSTKNLPTMSANTFYRLLVVTTSILLLMVVDNVTGILTYYWGRFFHIYVLMALYTYNILLMIGKSILETVLGRHTLDDAIEYHLSCRTLPGSFSEVMQDPDHAKNITPEFFAHVNKDRRIFLVAKDHRLGDRAPYFSIGEGEVDDILVYEPGVGVDLELYNIIFPRRLTNVLNMIRQRKMTLADLIANENPAGIDPYNRSIVDDHITGRPDSYLAKQLESPNAEMIWLERDVPAVPYTDSWIMGMGDNLRNSQVATGPKLFQDVELYIQTFLDRVYWPDFFNEPGTMSELRSAINMRTQLERNAVRRVKRTGKGEAIVDRRYAPDIYHVERSDEGIVNFGDEEDEATFVIEDEEA